MTVGKREKITYRKFIRTRRSGFLSPSQGIGYGLGETGIVLHKILSPDKSSPPQVRIVTVEATVVKETLDYLLLKGDRGALVRIRKADVVRRIKG